jgi:polysaccharide chain length determinant protein (PEP-CTERM system associated)
MSLVEAWLNALAKELQIHKAKLALGFAVVTFALLIAGTVWPKKYESGSLVFADEQNIIKPLLSGSAEVTKPEIDQVAIVRDRIVSNRLISMALIDAKMAAGNDDPKLDSMIGGVRGGIVVTDAGRGHVRIAYQAKQADKAYQMATALTNAYIKDTSRTKRQESSDAYEFIDNQVKTYKEQLQSAEDKLKNFKSQNPNAGDSSGRVAQLRSEQATLTLDLQIAKARRDELRRQMSQESQFVNRQFKSDGFRERLAQVQAQLDTLRLSYNDTYPDIVSLKQQMDDLRKAISDTENVRAPAEPSGGGANPVYTKLRGDLTDSEVSVRTLELKLDSNRKLLAEEQSYSKRGAEYDAQLAELTRDYTVTKQLYEDMLERKERARLSVALDVEGQGVTYKIKEPPAYPTVPVGLRFMHFFLLAPIAGVILPIGLLVAFIMFDPRLRFIDKLEFALPETVQVIAVIPHMSTTAERQMLRMQWFRVALFVVAVLVVYVTFALVRVMGVL